MNKKVSPARCVTTGWREPWPPGTAPAAEARTAPALQEPVCCPRTTKKMSCRPRASRARQLASGVGSPAAAAKTGRGGTGRSATKQGRGTRASSPGHTGGGQGPHLSIRLIRTHAMTHTSWFLMNRERNSHFCLQRWRKSSPDSACLSWSPRESRISVVFSIMRVLVLVLSSNIAEFRTTPDNVLLRPLVRTNWRKVWIF